MRAYLDFFEDEMAKLDYDWKAVIYAVVCKLLGTVDVGMGPGGTRWEIVAKTLSKGSEH